MDSLSSVSASSFLSSDDFTLAPDLHTIFGSDSPDSSECPGSPTSFPDTGNPSSSFSLHRSLPESLVGLSSTQFACGVISSASHRKCRLDVCMLFNHHARRVESAGVSDTLVVRCGEAGCRFIQPCISHSGAGIPTSTQSRSARRTRRDAYFVLVRDMMLARTLYVPPPMSLRNGGGYLFCCRYTHPCSPWTSVSSLSHPCFLRSRELEYARHFFGAFFQLSACPSWVAFRVRAKGDSRSSFQSDSPGGRFCRPR